MSRPTVFALLAVLPLACSAPSGRGSSRAGVSLSIPDDAPLRVVADGYLEAGDYLLRPLGPDGHAGVIVLRGLRGVTLDLQGVRLRGTPEGTPLDENAGWGIVVDDCSDVTLRGGRIGGYRVCIAVTRSRRVVVEDVAFDGWYGQRLRSTPAAEDQSDWLWPHDNDAGEWVAGYGAAVSFTDCEGVTLRRCRGRHGQNGILLTRTTESEVYDNDFSFLSGWGLGMYRSSNNTVSHNVFDYCVRGYSHGVYSRGQDSAGILMFERCCDNVVAFNSATHGGDGVFLYAGNDIVHGKARERGETEVGGGDRNLFYGNDLRHAPANAVEITFSRGNLVVRNDLSGCAQHGVWGGYSSDMLVLDNTIDDTAQGGITIEHGQDCVIADNRIRRNDIGVELYWDPDPQFVDGPFGEHQDTASRDHWLVGNVFEDNVQDVVLKETARVRFFDNDWGTSGRVPYVARLTADGAPDLDAQTVRGWMADREGALPTGHIAGTTLAEWTGRLPELLDEHGRMPPPDVPGEQVTRAEERGVPTGDRSTIVIGEWGPWDYRSGEKRPEPPRAGGLLADVSWRAVWFRWSEESGDPRGDVRAWRALAASPLVEKSVSHWTDPWGDDDVRAVVGGSRFGLVAETTFALKKAGRYELSVTSDDGVRVTLDGEEVLSDWSWHAARAKSAVLELDAGVHTFGLEYFQVDGAAALSLELEPAR